MQRMILIVSTLLVFIALNYGIFQKERIKANGDVVFLELAPVDPRSLMQGDYMRLRYAIERERFNLAPKARGYMVVALAPNKEGTFRRFYNGEALAADERLLRYHNRRGSIRIVPDSFMFQEGHAERYASAKYGVFMFDDRRNHLLIGLANEAMETIQP